MVTLDVHYSTAHVILTLSTAFIGSFSSVSLCEQYRLATLSASKKKRHLVLILVAIALGVGGTWSTLAVGFSSIKLYHADVEIPIRYNAGIVILAAIQCVIQIYIGMVVASTDDCFNKTRNEIIEKFIMRTSSTHTLEEIKKMSKLKIFFIVCTYSLERTVFGGVIAGSAVAVTQYILVQSLEFEGTIEYNPGIIVASFLFAIFNGAGAFWTFFRLLSLFPSLDVLRSVTALLGINAISGMHYIGMASLTFHLNLGNVRKDVPSNSATISQDHLYTGGVCSCVIMVCVMLMFVLHDLRSWLLRTSTQLRQADNVIAALSRKLKNQTAPHELVQYARTYMTNGSTRDSTHTASTSPTPSVTSPGRVAKSAKYQSLYHDYDEEEAIDSEVNSNANSSVHYVSESGANQLESICKDNAFDCEKGTPQALGDGQRLTPEPLTPPPVNAEEDMPSNQSQKKSSYDAGTYVTARSGSCKIVPTTDMEV